MTKRTLSEWWDELDEDGPETPERPRPAGKAAHKVHPGQNPIDRELALVASQDHHAGHFDFTYQASRHERQWLLQSLGSFYEHHWIRDVLRQVKGGKEASVYLCESEPEAGEQTHTGQQTLPELLAAKVYRPRMLRNLKNDALYREGRSDLDSEGHEILDDRMLRAIQKRTAFGQELRHTSWLEHEFTALQALSQAGADVPVPYASDANAILMTYIGEDGLPAPTLASIHLTRHEAQALYQRTLRNIEIMLSRDIIHGDLSAFNILYWDGDHHPDRLPAGGAPGEEPQRLPHLRAGCAAHLRVLQPPGCAHPAAAAGRRPVDSLPTFSAARGQPGLAGRPG